MVASKNTLLKDSGFGSDSTYGNYNTYSDQGFAQQQEDAVNPLATNAGYVYSPASRPVSTKIQQSQWILAGSALCFIAAIALGFVQNTHIAADLGHLSSGASIAAGICQVLTAFFLYGVVAYLMNRRENNGRMIGIAFALIGICMGLIWAILGFMTGTLLGELAAIFCLGVVLFNCIWLYQTNQPVLHKQLRK